MIALMVPIFLYLTGKLKFKARESKKKTLMYFSRLAANPAFHLAVLEINT